MSVLVCPVHYKYWKTGESDMWYILAGFHVENSHHQFAGSNLQESYFS